MLFDQLAQSLQTDAQRFIDTFVQTTGIDEPILAFCLYFDSENGSASAVMLPKSVQQGGVDVSDVAAWRYQDEWLAGDLSEQTLELFEQYNERLLDEEPDEDEPSLQEQFVAMIRLVLSRLTFESLNKASDFMFFAQAMDEEYDLIEETVPPKLINKYF